MRHALSPQLECPLNLTPMHVLSLSFAPMSYGGGGPAVVIPIVALILYWLIKKGRFKIVDWIFVLLILVISLASGKRQPIIIYPAILFALFVFVSKSIRLISLLKYLLIALVVFYFGVRMTATITPEKKIWGSFDISFISKYVIICNC